jgi:hypothetical protein
LIEQGHLNHLGGNQAGHCGWSVYIATPRSDQLPWISDDSREFAETLKLARFSTRFLR